jgi:hypothetical protein
MGKILFFTTDLLSDDEGITQEHNQASRFDNVSGMGRLIQEGERRAQNESLTILTWSKTTQNTSKIIQNDTKMVQNRVKIIKNRAKLLCPS